MVGDRVVGRQSSLRRSNSCRWDLRGETVITLPVRPVPVEEPGLLVNIVARQKRNRIVPVVLLILGLWGTGGGGG